VHASRRRLGSSRSDPLLRRPELPSSMNAWHWKRHRANSSGSMLRSRRSEPPSSSGMRESRSSTGS
jgi:hypothetical protein